MKTNIAPPNAEIFKALDGFHAKTNLVKATKENPFLKNKYASYNEVVLATKADLAENGLRVKQAITNIDGKTAIYTALIHIESGAMIESVAPVAHKDNDPQSQGSGITYMKRYSYIAILDLLVDADDDGNLAAGLGKVAERNEAVEKAIAKLQLAKNSGELKDIFMSLGNLIKDKRVVAEKDRLKMDFTE